MLCNAILAKVAGSTARPVAQSPGRVRSRQISAHREGIALQLLIPRLLWALCACLKKKEKDYAIDANNMMASYFMKTQNDDTEVNSFWQRKLTK